MVMPYQWKQMINAMNMPLRGQGLGSRSASRAIRRPAVTTDEDLRYDVSDRIAEISLARPPVNALSLALLEPLIAALRLAAADENVRAVLLTSALPRRFSAGLDLGMMLSKSATEVRRLLGKLYVELADAQYDLGKPSIAAVGGSARGGGMTLAISCDVLVAGRSATFGYPEAA
jgi:enoyl-CoA hydratase